MADFTDHYRDIYLRGTAGETPTLPVSIEALEQAAEAAMEPWAANYVFAAAGGEETMRANREALRRRRIAPRMLRDVSERNLASTILGTPLPAPLMLAPIGVQKVVHEQGELATARAAATLGVPMIVSSASHFTIEEIAAAGGDRAPRWFQLYWPNDPRLLESFIGRAEAAGYEAIVLTVDAFIPGWKPRDLQQARLPFLQGMGNANYLQDPVFRAELERPPEEDLGAATGHYLSVLANPSLAWEDLELLRELTSLPVLVKGIQRADDALEAARRGVDGIVVSNHGGRQVDGAIGSLDALESIVAALADSDLTILFDSGVRSGSDVIKALALGADAVLLGRPYLWGLALEGQEGVETVLKMILAELELSMALCGYARPEQIGPDALA